MFSVPDQYRRDHLYTAGLMSQGFIEEFPETSPEAETFTTIEPSLGITLSESISQHEQHCGLYSLDDLAT